MSAPLRFLSVTVLAWGGIRAMTMGTVSGFTVGHAASVPPAPIVPTELAAPAPTQMAVEPVGWDEPLQPQPAGTTLAPRLPAAYARPYPVPYYVAAYPPAGLRRSVAPLEPRRAWSLSPGPAPAYPAFVPAAAAAGADYAGLPPLVPAGAIEQRSLPVAAAAPVAAKLDRWMLSSWAVLRGAPAPGALAAGGTLGGSQGGARVTYAFNRNLAASLRLTSPLGGSRGTEVAGGIRWAPLRSLPVAITAERRQSLSPDGGGRSDFALFAEAGIYRRPLPWRFELDAYAQAGIVGLAERDLFADGQSPSPAPCSAVSPPASARGAATSPAFTGSMPARACPTGCATTSGCMSTGASG